MTIKLSASDQFQINLSAVMPGVLFRIETHVGEYASFFATPINADVQFTVQYRALAKDYRAEPVDFATDRRYSDDNFHPTIGAALAALATDCEETARNASALAKLLKR